MNEKDIPIDIAVRKLLDWLVRYYFILDAIKICNSFCSPIRNDNPGVGFQR